MRRWRSNPAFTITTGKMVLEISVVHANKGEGLATLRASTAATAVFFAGDDVTDEHGFAVLLPGDVGHQSGRRQHPRPVPHRLPAGTAGSS